MTDLGLVLRSVVAETIGTFALVFIGCGAIMANAQRAALGSVGIATAFGLVVMAMVAALGHVSGAHLNPAVTLAFALGRHFPARSVLAYWAAQATGALAAALLLRASLAGIANVGATTPARSDAQSFVWEVVLTFFLTLVIIGVATDTRAVGETAAVAIGGTIAFASLAADPFRERR